MTEATVEALSKRDPTSGADLLGTCTVVVGDGTMKIDFVNGRAQVPVSLIEMALKHPHVMIPGHGDQAGPGSELEAARKRIAELEELAAARGRIAELEAVEVKAAREAPKPQEQPAVEFADSEQPPEVQFAEQPAGEGLDPRVQDAIDHLRAEGEDVPEIEPLASDPAVSTAPAPAQPNPAFETHTADGNPRCQAAKADGAQCANAAINDQACQLGKHQEQLAS